MNFLIYLIVLLFIIFLLLFITQTNEQDHFDCFSRVDLPHHEHAECSN